jgi:hypothetical protein
MTMSSETESTKVARAIFAVLIAGVAISFAVVGYLALAGASHEPAASLSADNTLPLVRADRTPARLPPS